MDAKQFMAQAAREAFAASIIPIKSPEEYLQTFLASSWNVFHDMIAIERRGTLGIIPGKNILSSSRAHVETTRIDFVGLLVQSGVSRSTAEALSQELMKSSK